MFIQKIPKIILPENLSNYKFDEISSKIVHHDERYTEIESVFNIDEKKVFTKGNLSLIQAQPKAGKTTASLMIIHDILEQNPLNEIVLFDTEQERNDCVYYMHRLKQMSMYFGRLKLFPLRLYSHDIRLEFISEYIEKNRPAVAFIDNIRDCMVSINDTDQSHKLRTQISQLAEHTRTHICLTLHENPKSEKARGHIGTELANQVEVVVRIENDDETGIFTIKRVMGRRKKFDNIYFTVNENGIPEKCSEFSTSNNIPKTPY